MLCVKIQNQLLISIHKLHTMLFVANHLTRTCLVIQADEHVFFFSDFCVDIYASSAGQIPDTFTGLFICVISVSQDSRLCLVLALSCTNSTACFPGARGHGPHVDIDR